MEDRPAAKGQVSFWAQPLLGAGRLPGSSLYQASTSWPVSVTKTMISHWADGFPSSV